MAERYYWIGTLGPYFYDDEDTFEGATGEPLQQSPLTFEKEARLLSVLDLLEIDALSSTPATELGAEAKAGESLEVSRADHVHPYPEEFINQAIETWWESAQDDIFWDGYPRITEDGIQRVLEDWVKRKTEGQ